MSASQPIGSPQRMVRLFLVDDHQAVRDGVRAVAELESDIAVVGEAATGLQAIEGVARAQPDVVVLDLRLPDLDGVEVCREIRSRNPDIQVLILTGFGDEESMLHSIMAGAAGYLLKTGSTEGILDAVRAVAGGRSLIDPGLVASMIQKTLARPKDASDKLSEQQQKVLDLIVEGLTNRQIADRLGLAEKTVKNYVSALLERLGVHSRTQAAVYAARRKREEREGAG